MSAENLPQYDAPPAVETLMGVYFANYAGWNILHFGKLWSLFQKDYPKGDILPPIIDPRKIAQGDLEFSQLPFRAMFTDASNSQLVQVQASAFLRNWRKTVDNQAYTHYADLKPKFQADWKTFSMFLEETGFSRPQVFQCEVTYVNHLARGVEWHSYNDLAKLLKPFAPRSVVADHGRKYTFLPEAATVALSVGYNLTDAGVSLQITCQSAVRRPDGLEVIQLTVTAKGDISNATDEGIWEMLDRCHDSVIVGFDDVTTEFAHQLWGKTMTVVDSPTTLNAKELIQPLTVRQALLTTQGYHSMAPWQYIVYSKLHDLEEHLIGANAQNELTAAQSTVTFARTVIADLHSMNIPSPIICPISGGGIGMFWSLGPKQLEVVFAADQSGTFILSKGEQIVSDGEITPENVASLERALKSVMSV